MVSKNNLPYRQKVRPSSLSMLHYPTLPSKLPFKSFILYDKMDNNAISPESRSLFSFCLSTDNKNCHTYKSLNVVKRHCWCLNCCKKELDFLRWPDHSFQVPMPNSPLLFKLFTLCLLYTSPSPRDA